MNQDVLNSKVEVVKELVDLVKNSQSFVICEYRGLTVEKLTSLRRSLLAKDSKMTVYKNTLVKRALAELKIEGLDSTLEGPNAFVFSKDLIEGPKIITKFAKQNEELVIKGGYLDGRACSADEVKAIAKLPGREGLLSMFLSVLQAPIRNLACAIKAVADKQN